MPISWVFPPPGSFVRGPLNTWDLRFPIRKDSYGLISPLLLPTAKWIPISEARLDIQRTASF